MPAVLDEEAANERGWVGSAELCAVLRERGPAALRDVLVRLHERGAEVRIPQASPALLPEPGDDFKAYLRVLGGVGAQAEAEVVERLWQAEVADVWADVRGVEDGTGTALRACVRQQLQRRVVGLAKARSRLGARVVDLVGVGNEVAARMVEAGSIDDDLYGRFSTEVAAVMAEANTRAFHQMALEARVYFAQFWSDHEDVLGAEQLMAWGLRMWEDAQGSEPDVEPKMRISRRACGLHKLYCAVERVDEQLAQPLVEAMARRRKEVTIDLRCHGCIGSALAELRLEQGEPAAALEALERTLMGLDRAMKPRQVSMLLLGMRCGVALADGQVCRALAKRIEPLLRRIERACKDDGRSPIDRAWVEQQRLEMRFLLALVDGELDAAQAVFETLEAHGESVVATLIELAIDWVGALDDLEHNAEAVRIARTYADVAERRGRLSRAQRLLQLGQRCCEDPQQAALLRARADAIEARVRQLHERWGPRLSVIEA